jgi:hypothetical protein
MLRRSPVAASECTRDRFSAYESLSGLFAAEESELWNVEQLYAPGGKTRRLLAGSTLPIDCLDCGIGLAFMRMRLPTMNPTPG